jgi:hypothetical protein
MSGERRNDHDDAPAQLWIRIEAKKTFAGLTRARRPLPKSALIERRHGRFRSAA